jgi:hypothetical protein
MERQGERVLSGSLISGFRPLEKQRKPKYASAFGEDASIR